MGFSIGDLYMTLLADGGRLKQSIEQEATKAADAAGAKVGKTLGESIASNLTKQGRDLQKTGTSLTKNVTAPILGLGAAVVGVGVQFDTTLRQIVALTDVTADEIGGVRKEILGMATALGKDPNELARGFYFLASAGFDTAEALEVLKSTAKASAAGLGETADISRVVGSAINAFGKENLTAGDAVDQLIRAVKDGTAEAPEFAGALGDVLGSAGQLGATFADTTAAIAAMTLKGIGADEAATSLNQVFVSLLKTTPAAEEALSGLGLSSSGLRQELKEKGLLAVLQTLSDKFEGNDEAAAAVFGNIRALRGILALTSGDAAQVAGVFQDVANGTDNLGKAFAETEGPGREMDRAFTEIKVALIELSDDVLPQLLPVLHAAVGFIHGGVQAFKALPAPVRGAIVQLAGLAAALGPVLFVSGKVVSGFGQVIGAFRTLTNVGKSLIPVLSKVIGNLALGGAPKIGDAADKTGGLLGSRLGKAMSLAFAAVAVVEVINTYNEIRDGLNAQSDQIATDLSNQIKAGTDAELAQSKAALETGIDQLNQVWDAGIFTNEQRERLQAQLDATNAEIARRAAMTPKAVADKIKAGKAELAAAAGEGIEQPVMSAIDALIARARLAGRYVPESVAAGILERQSVVPDAMDVLKNLIKNALTPAKQIARDIGILTSKTLAQGLKSPIPEVRQEAQRVQAVAEQELAELIAGGGKVGKNAMDKLKEGLHSKNPDVRAAAKRVKALVVEELDKAKNGARDAGAAAGAAFAGALNAKVGTIRIDFGIFAGKLVPRAGGGPVMANEPYLIGEQGPEVFVPDTPGTVLPNQFVDAAGAGRGGDTYHNTWVMPEPTRDPYAVLDRTARYVRWGRLRPEPSGG